MDKHVKGLLPFMSDAGTPGPGRGNGRRGERRRHALRHPTRRRLLALVTAEPGIRVGALSSRADLSWASLWFHLRILALVGLVRFRTENRERRVYPGRLARTVLPLGPLRLQDPAARRLAEALRQRPGCGLSEAAAALSASPCLAHHHASRLVQAGLLRREERGGLLALRPTEELERLLDAKAADQPNR